MMHIEPQDWSAAAQNIEARLKEFRADIADGFAQVDRQVNDQFRDEQLSGRKGDDTGLNIVTGTLHDSIKDAVEVADEMISGVVYNEGAPYWYYHQEPDGQKKRLFFDEYFSTQGLEAYTAVAERALMEMAA